MEEPVSMASAFLPGCVRALPLAGRSYGRASNLVSVLNGIVFYKPLPEACRPDNTKRAHHQFFSARMRPYGHAALDHAEASTILLTELRGIRIAYIQRCLSSRKAPFGEVKLER